MASLGGLLPVFLILAVGVAARRWGLISEGAAVGLNRLVANVALPALFLIKVGTAPFEASFSGRLVGATTALVVAFTVVGLAVAAVWRLPRDQRGVLAQAAMRGNIAYVAFPVVLATAGDAGLRQAAVTSAALIPAMNFLAVGVLEAHRGPAHGWVRLMSRVAVNPMVVSALAGLALSALRWQPWAWLAATLEMLADFSLPAALLALGSQLAVGRWREVWRQAAVATALKLVLMPAAGWWALRTLGAAPLETAVGVLLLAAPTAVASYPVAADLGGDTDLAGACVLATTVGSFAAYPAWTLLVLG